MRCCSPPLPAPTREISLAAAFRKAELDVEDLEAAKLDGLAALEGGNVSFRHPLVSSVVYQGESEAFDGVPPTRCSRKSTRTSIARPGIAQRQRLHRDEAVAAELDAAAGRALARGAPDPRFVRSRSRPGSP